MIRLFRRLGFVPVPELVVSAERVNRSVLAERAREYAGDVKYRAKVKRRMLLGYACAEPPLIVTAAWRPRLLRAVGER
ncbi:MAG: hypothetical protein ACM33U_08640 [Solirubrobacterales bacterium]